MLIATSEYYDDSSHLQSKIVQRVAIRCVGEHPPGGRRCPEASETWLLLWVQAPHSCTTFGRLCLFIVPYAVHPGSASRINLAYKLVNASFL